MSKLNPNLTWREYHIPAEKCSPKPECPYNDGRVKKNVTTNAAIPETHKHTQSQFFQNEFSATQVRFLIYTQTHSQPLMHRHIQINSSVCVITFSTFHYSWLCVFIGLLFPEDTVLCLYNIHFSIHKQLHVNKCNKQCTLWPLPGAEPDFPLSLCYTALCI